MKVKVCKTCGTEVLNGEEICPECGCVCNPKIGRRFTPKSVFFSGISVLVYSIICCFTDYKYGNSIPIIAIGCALVCIYAAFSFLNNKSKKNFIGVSLAVIAIIISVCSYIYWDNHYIKTTVNIDEMGVKCTFSYPEKMDYQKLVTTISFFPKGTTSVDNSKYYITSIGEMTFDRYKEYQDKYTQKRKYIKTSKINKYLYIHYLEDTNYAVFYNNDSHYMVTMEFYNDKYEDEVIKILACFEIEEIT